MCISATNFNNDRNSAENSVNALRLKYRLISACRFRICTQNVDINNTFVDIRCPIFNSLMNKLIH